VADLGFDPQGGGRGLFQRGGRISFLA